MRRGISYTAERYSTGNNKYMQSCDNKKPSMYNIYVDNNN